MNLLDPIKNIVIDRKDYLMNRAVLGQAFDGLLKYLSLKEKDWNGVITFSAGSTGFTPITATRGNVILGGILSTLNGGTGLSGPFANGQILIGNGTGFTASTIIAGAGIAITNGPGSITITNTGGGGGGGGTVTSVDLTMPAAFTVSGNPITTSGTLAVTAIGTALQYIRGDGVLATFPTIPSVTPSALTRINDTNVTLTLTGTPSSALLQSVGLTLGWTGILSVARGGTGLGSLGAATNYLRVNAAGTALEYWPFPSIPSGTVTSVSASVPSPASPAYSVTVTNPTTTPSIAITANGATTQYVRGDGSLATFPTIPAATTVTGRTGDINVVTSGSNYEVQNAVLPFLLMGC